jgi:hypothetical protein
MWRMRVSPLWLEEPHQLLALRCHWFHPLLWLLWYHVKKGALLCLLWNAPPGMPCSHYSFSVGVANGFCSSNLGGFLVQRTHRGARRSKTIIGRCMLSYVVGAVIE